MKYKSQASENYIILTRFTSGVIVSAGNKGEFVPVNLPPADARAMAADILAAADEVEGEVNIDTPEANIEAVFDVCKARLAVHERTLEDIQAWADKVEARLAALEAQAQPEEAKCKCGHTFVAANVGSAWYVHCPNEFCGTEDWRGIAANSRDAKAQASAAQDGRL